MATSSQSKMATSKATAKTPSSGRKAGLRESESDENKDISKKKSNQKPVAFDDPTRVAEEQQEDDMQVGRVTETDAEGKPLRRGRPDATERWEGSFSDEDFEYNDEDVSDYESRRANAPSGKRVR